MPTLLFLNQDGSERRVAVPVGTSVMRAAIANDVRGIDGECGGCLSCATCHVWVDEPDLDRLPPPTEDELAMLDFVVAERRPTSRLSCQIEMTESLDGLRVHVPDAQV